MKIAALLLVLVLLATGYANVCGGNCPVGNCPTCPCGYTTIKIDLDTFCTAYSWNQNCCKCIAQRISAGSQNFMKYEGNTFKVGILGVGEAESIGLCNFHPWSLTCFSYKDNAQCANRIYMRDGGWGYWAREATACGCLQSDNLSEVTA